MFSREKNRIHAKNTRERKKLLVGSYQAKIKSLMEEVWDNAFMFNLTSHWLLARKAGFYAW